MSFIQKKLTKSINQSRGIFDKFLYKPANGDTLTDISESGYFSKSRYIDDPDWEDSIIEVDVVDGYFVGRIDGDGDFVVTPTEVIYISEDYQIKPTDRHIVSDGGNTITFPFREASLQEFTITHEGVVNDALDGNGSTIPTSSILTPTQSRSFIAGSSAWLEV
jgi:hypothetical protein